jgi:hypothetical protein
MIVQLRFSGALPALGEVRRKVGGKSMELLDRIGAEGADCVHP